MVILPLLIKCPEFCSRKAIVGTYRHSVQLVVQAYSAEYGQ